MSASVRDQIRNDLLDEVMLGHLEGCGSINWNSTVTWQCRPIERGVAEGGVAAGATENGDWVDANQLGPLLEV